MRRLAPPFSMLPVASAVLTVALALGLTTVPSGPRHRLARRHTAPSPAHRGPWLPSQGLQWRSRANSPDRSPSTGRHRRPSARWWTSPLVCRRRRLRHRHRKHLKEVQSGEGHGRDGQPAHLGTVFGPARRIEGSGPWAPSGGNLPGGGSGGPPSGGTFPVAGLVGRPAAGAFPVAVLDVHVAYSNVGFASGKVTAYFRLVDGLGVLVGQPLSTEEERKGHAADGQDLDGDGDCVLVDDLQREPKCRLNCSRGR